MLSLRPQDVEAGSRQRPVCMDAVDRLARSMEQIGLRHPISIRIADNVMVDGSPCDGVPVLVAGAHRLEAAKRLGWEAIDCIEVDDDPISAELWELSENLHRLDLTKEQRDQHIRRYAELLEYKVALEKEQVRQNDAPERGVPPKQVKGAARRIAEETGISVRTVQRALNPPQPKSAMPDYDVVTVQFNSLMAAWNRAGSEARSRFVDEIGGAL